MKRAFITGLILFLPLGITVWLLLKVFRLFTSPLLGLADVVLNALETHFHVSLQMHQTLAHGIARLLSLMLFLCAALLLGFTGRKFMGWISDLMFARIPFIGWIYRLSKEVTTTMFDPKNTLFKQTILVPYPHSDAFALGFLVGDTPSYFHKYVQKTEVVVFVPTAPYSVAGFLLLYPSKNTYPTGLTIEDGCTFLLRGGSLDPTIQK